MKDHCFINQKEVANRLIPIDRNAHKWSQGHALLIGGSYGKIGSVCLSAKACLKSGAGLVTAYIPKCGYTILQTALPEAMVITDDYNTHITTINPSLKPQAIGIGIGMGKHPETQQALFHFLKLNTTPLVVDADALNILSENIEWLHLLPQHSILTPHTKELTRLVGEWPSEEIKTEKLITLSTKYNLVIVAKGAPSLVVYHDLVFQNTTGNQALATAGSGDVLTGIITAFLAQGYSALDAAILGVYLHGLTADLAVPKTGYHAFIASDIIAYLSEAFLSLEKNNRKEL